METQILDSRHFQSRFLCLGFGADIVFDRYNCQRITCSIISCSTTRYGICLYICLSECSSVCSTITIDSLDIETYFWSVSTHSGYLGQVGRFRRSSGQGQSYSHKTANSLFPQCKSKTSFGNNSGSVENRTVKFAYCMRFSAMADRIA